jgi:hypothetical protein
MAPQASTLFSNKSGTDLVDTYDAFQKAMMEAPNTAKGDVALTPTDGGGQVLTKVQSPNAQAQSLLSEGGFLSKALSPEVLASVTQQLEQVNVQKDFTLTNPLATGYVAYDLDAPAKMMYPRPTIIRNRVPREKGVGVAYLFKRIDGISGSKGGPALVNPAITDTSTATFGTNLVLNRGPKISYAGSDVSIPYLQFGLSDSVPWSAQFAGEGFMDARGVSKSSVLYSSMLAEEYMMLLGRGTNASFQGALAAPANPTLGARAAAGGEAGLTGVTTNVYVQVTAISGMGETTPSGTVSVAAANGQVVDVTIPTVAGAAGYNVYVGTGAADPGAAQHFFAATGSSKVLTITGALPTSGNNAGAVASNTTAQAGNYDGIVPICLGTNSGYTKDVGGALSTTSPGVELQNAFAAMYAVNLADPDEVLASGYDRKQLSEALRSSGSTSGYRISIDNSGNPEQRVGQIVTGLVNEVTGKMVDLTVHPYLPQGVMPILSHTLPFADSNVGPVWFARNVQDYMAIDWPVIQNSFDTSTYWFGTFGCRAPKWQGGLYGIKKV